MSTITSPSQSLSDFSELAEKLQSTAQALLAFSSSAVTEPEKEMLELLKAENWQHMFDKTYEQLYTMALLMQHCEVDEEVDGYSVQLMGNTLMVPLDLLSRLCSLIADFRPASEVDLEVE